MQPVVCGKTTKKRLFTLNTAFLILMLIVYTYKTYEYNWLTLVVDPSDPTV